MLNKLESTIQSIITAATQNLSPEIARVVRAALAAEFAGIVGPASSGHEPARAPGRPKKAAAAAPKEQPAPATTAAGKNQAVAKPVKAVAAKSAPKAPKGKIQRRTSEQVAADDAKILAHVKAHPGLRSIDMKKAIGLPKQNLSSGLDRLRDGGKVKMTGTRSAATYSAA